MDRPIRVALADDHRLFRDGLRRLLELEPDVMVVGEATNGEEAVHMVLSCSPDVVLLDLNMPKMSGSEVIRRLSASSDRQVRTKFIAITAYDDDEHVSSLSELGINGYILKSSGMTELMQAIRSVMEGEAYVDPKVASKLLTTMQRKRSEDDVFGLLTAREREVLYWLSQGFNNAEISAKMMLSEKTVKNHVSHMLKKLELNDRTKAAVLAWRTGMVNTPPPLE